MTDAPKPDPSPTVAQKLFEAFREHVAPTLASWDEQLSGTQARVPAAKNARWLFTFKPPPIAGEV